MIKSIELEQSLIGGLFLNNDRIAEVSAILRPEHMGIDGGRHA